MTINERIRALRKEHLKLSQTEFALLIGMKQTSVSSFEKPGATVTDQTIKSICFAVEGLNEEWLRTGNGDMIIEPETFSLDDFAAQHNASEIDLLIAKTYFELPADVRSLLIERFRNVLNSPAATATEEMTVADAEELYKKNILNSAQKTAFTASDTTSGTSENAKAVNEN